MTLTSRQIVAAFAVIATAVITGFVAREASNYLMIVGAAGAFATLLVGSPGSTKGLDEVSAGLAELARGQRPSLPEHASPQVARVFEQISKVADRMSRGDELDEAVAIIGSALRAAVEGTRTPAPSGASPDLRRLFDDIDRVAQRMAAAREAAALLDRSGQALEGSARRLADGINDRARTVREAGEAVQALTASLQDLARQVDALANASELSSTSISQMTSTNDEVAASIAELAASVRETASSIEEMAYSIKEVAKNVDALALTAEETSSSMNEMDVSIDQVQSNANETARLSEEVAQDAERGAEAILKTIGEIYRIKESTQEAVAVISNLGSKIDAIGQILNVIDDVAEQTNLLALNAAIIAAQAGEHGKGFAVVADEIKDLAERAGASTKEIAELTKTIQNESRNAILAVERGAKNVDRGVEVSNEAEHALKKILESSQKSTNMVRAIARATVEQAKGSRQVTDAIGRIAETVQQIAAATAEQARGSELIMRSADKMRSITQQVERSSQEQARGGRQVTEGIDSISSVVEQLHQAHRQLSRSSEALLSAAGRFEAALRDDEAVVRELGQAAERMRSARAG